RGYRLAPPRVNAQPRLDAREAVSAAFTLRATVVVCALSAAHRCLTGTHNLPTMSCSDHARAERHGGRDRGTCTEQALEKPAAALGPCEVLGEFVKLKASHRSFLSSCLLVCIHH